jgi:hypothetical protein
MIIKLSWVDVNGYGDFRIYRNTSPIDIDDLPLPLTTINNNGTQNYEYVDSDVVDMETYHYRVSTFFGNEERFTDNARVVAYYQPTEIGEMFQGGQYVGNVVVGDDTYGIIAALSAEQAQWKTSNTATTGTGSLVDGWANTLAMITAGELEHPAAGYCRNYTGGGFDDWYLPARNELNLMWTNRSLLSLGMTSDYYWTSSQSSANVAHAQYFSNGSQGTYAKVNQYYVRPVRRIKLIL